MPYYVYVTLVDEDRVLVFEMDPESGRLDQRGDVAVPGGPAPLAISPDRAVMYAGFLVDPKVTSFRIDQATGGLSPIGTAPLDSDPCYLATDRTGRFLFSAHYFAGRVGVHRIGGDGVVETPPVEWLDTAPGAHSMQADRSNRFVFVPHIAGDVGPNRVFQFRFDQTTGRLTPNSPPQAMPDDGVGPRHFCFHPELAVVYFSNEQGCSVSAYRLDPSTGTLTTFDTVSTLPDGYEGPNSCSQIQISPSGRYLYAPNRGHDSIACFSVDPATGRLTSIGRVPSEAVPRAFSLDPDGRFLFAAGLESGRLASYSIDQQTGMPEPLEVYELGKGPMWVLTTTLGH